MTKNKAPLSYIELLKKSRNSWNGVNPVSRIEQDKRKKKPKYKHKDEEYD